MARRPTLKRETQLMRIARTKAMIERTGKLIRKPRQLVRCRLDRPVNAFRS